MTSGKLIGLVVCVLPSSASCGEAWRPARSCSDRIRNWNSDTRNTAEFNAKRERLAVDLAAVSKKSSKPRRLARRGFGRPGARKTMPSGRRRLPSASAKS